MLAISNESGRTRRELIALAAAIPMSASAAGKSRREFAITIDDVAWQAIPQPYRENASERLLRPLREQGHLHAALFVTGRNVDSPEGHSVLERWSREGHLLANHTWSHRVYGASMDPAEFAADMLRCDKLMRSFPGFRPLFRFPALEEGSTRQRRDWMRAHLREHGYRNGHVTIDASDWYYDQRLRARLQKEPGFDVNRFRAPYLGHIWNRAVYYDDLAFRVLGRTVPHTLLIHFNLLNSLFLGDLLKMFRSKGWHAIDAAKAFENEVFQREPDTVPAGESLIWALAKETRRYDGQLRYPAEDEPYERPILDALGL